MEIIGGDHMSSRCKHFTKPSVNGCVENVFVGPFLGSLVSKTDTEEIFSVHTQVYKCDSKEGSPGITRATWVEQRRTAEAVFKIIDHKPPITDVERMRLASINLWKQLDLDSSHSMVGEAIVNAEGKTFSVIGTASARSQPIALCNWSITPPAFNKVSRDEIKAFMVETFKNGITILNEVSETALDIKTGDEILMETKSFYIRFEDSYSESIVNNKSMEGAGQFCELDALHPLLMLLYLQSSFKEKYRHEKKLVKICDEEGALIDFDYRSIDSIQATLDRMKIDAEMFRHYAAPLGLLPVIYNLAEMESVHEDMFF